MKPLRLTLLAAPVALAVGCLLPSFETLDEPPGSGGSGGSAGGSGGNDDGGATSQGGEDSAGGEGGRGQSTPLTTRDDRGCEGCASLPWPTVTSWFSLWHSRPKTTAEECLSMPS